MRRNFQLTWLICCSALSVFPRISLAEEQLVDPVATRKVLTALLAVSNSAIPNGSTCRGDYGQTGQAKIKDMLAMQLGYLYEGDNRIKGNCTQDACAIVINHAAGEDVSSARIQFGMRNGKVDLATLHCVMTP